MQAKIINDEIEFKPFNIEISIESKEDLMGLLALANTSTWTIAEHLKDNFDYYKCSSDLPHDLYERLHLMAIDLGLVHD